MRLRKLFFAFFLVCLGISELKAQATLFEENFDNCILSAGWQVNITGNPNPTWYVGPAVLNNDNQGQNMNGSCFLFIDDDATGNQTPAYTIDFVSPPFDASQYATVELSLDVHYRDYGPSAEYFEVRVTDGNTETLLKRFEQGGSTGDTLSEYVTLKYDLSLVNAAPNLRLILRYDDGGGFAWWAGVDNIKVVGKGVGTNVVTQNFNQCAKPANWETQIVSGDNDWIFGKATVSGNANLNSIDGSCMVYFNDDALTSAAPYSTVRLFSPWFDGTDFGQFELNFDLVHRYATEIFTVYVQNGQGEESAVAQWSDDVGGPYFNNPVHQTLDLSPYRAKEMRVIFEYSDGNGWGWWTALDNVKITGSGAANDLCTNALELLTGDDCKHADNRNAVFEGPQPSCSDKAVAGLWYRWQADFTGVAKLTTHADFNDVVNVYTGGCQTLSELLCDNYDEHGFQGEGTLFAAQAGTEYLIRVSGQDAGFGRPRGDMCLEIDPTTGFPTAPPNDNCPDAMDLAVNGTCVDGNNRYATTSAIVPSLNTLARADVWYKFTAPISPAPGQKLEVRSNADFSDIITVYAGGCASLSEVAGNHLGQKLDLQGLAGGQTYWVQIAGNFATVEGNLCAQISQVNEDAPANDNCLQAVPVPLGGQCAASNNFGASFSGYQPGCVVQADRDVWFTFVAPASGSVRFNTGADFSHVLALWQGDCSGLTQVYCAENPLRCEGYPLVGNLLPGQTYYVQIASWDSPVGLVSGNICLSIIDGATMPPFEPLVLHVQEQCIDVDLAKLEISASGGLAPYEFLGNADGQQIASGAEYLVIVADANGCQQALTGIVDNCTEAGCLVTASFNAQNPSCAGEATGSITATPADGQEPYSFLWSNGDTTAVAAGLNAGVYLVTITDASNCEFVAAQTLIEPPGILAEIAAVNHPHQGQNDGSVEVNAAGGTGSLQFEWVLNATVVATTQNLNNAAPGDYTLTIWDGNGCSVVLTVTLTETVGTGNPNDVFYAEVLPNPIKDKGWLTIKLPVAAELHLSLSDGQGRNLRDWSAGTVLAQQIPLDFSELPAGMYWLKIVAGEEVVVRKVAVAR